LVSPNWCSQQDPRRKFDVHYALEGQCEPRLVLRQGEQWESIPLSVAESRGIISPKDATHIRAVTDLIRKAAARRPKHH
jgi:hypothetical protein